MKPREFTEAEAEALERAGIEESRKIATIARLISAGCFLLTMIVIFALEAGGIL